MCLSFSHDNDTSMQSTLVHMCIYTCEIENREAEKTKLIDKYSIFKDRVSYILLLSFLLFSLNGKVGKEIEN